MFIWISDDEFYYDHSNGPYKSLGENVQLNITKVLGYLIEFFNINLFLFIFE